MKKIFLIVLIICFITIGCSHNDKKDTEKLWWLDNDKSSINIEDIWKITKGSKEIIVGIIDSGIDVSSKEIRDSIYVNKKEVPDNDLDDDKNGYIDDLNGWNFYDDNNMIYNSYTSDYHGTMVAGIISGKSYGIATNIKVLPLKCFRGMEGSIDDVVRAIDYAYDFGVRIFNCSWDMEQYSDKLYKTMQEYSDAVFVCSACKNANNIAKQSVYPACFDLDNIIVVGGTTETGQVYEFSGYGGQVDIYAPAKNIYCTMPDETYTYSEGTSLSVAFVTGGIALVKSIDSELDCREIKKRLYNCPVIDGRKNLDIKILCGFD